MLTITFLILVVHMLLMILTVPTVSLSAVSPLCLVRLVGGGEGLLFVTVLGFDHIA